MELPRAHKKLRETRFFLGKLSEKTKSTQLASEEFEFYLSAFLSSGRSVTWVLQKEYGGGKDLYRPFFDAWLNKQISEDQKLFKYMNEQRVAEVHLLGADVKSRVEMVPVHSVSYQGQGHPAYYGFFVTGPPGIPPPEIGQNVYYFPISENPEEVTQVCQKYLKLLEKWVEEFSKNPPTSTSA